MKTKFLYIAIVFFISVNKLMAVDYPMHDLKLFADGLNIEGGTIVQKYLKQGQVWANLCIVLDRPFEDGMEWQELTKLNTFPLKEASITDYNEAQVNYVYALVMHYYMTHTHQIANKSLDQKAKILIQVHRNTSGPCHIELLEKLLFQCYPEIQGFKQNRSVFLSKYELSSYFIPSLNVEINFCYGVAPENLGEIGKYNEADVIVSFSLVAGLHENWKSGSLLIPKQYIPFPLKQASISLKTQYLIRNHLQEAISDMIENNNEKVLEIINKNFASLNLEKSHLKAKGIVIEDFKEAILLQVDGLFNPSELPPIFKCVD